MMSKLVLLDTLLNIFHMWLLIIHDYLITLVRFKPIFLKLNLLFLNIKHSYTSQLPESTILWTSYQKQQLQRNIFNIICIISRISTSIAATKTGGQDLMHQDNLNFLWSTLLCLCISMAGVDCLQVKPVMILLGAGFRTLLWHTSKCCQMCTWLSPHRRGIHWQQELWYWLLGHLYGPVPREEECSWDAIECRWLQLQAWPGDRGWKPRNMGVK